MDKRVEQWCTDHHAVLLQPYQSALRPVRLRCTLCGTERTERASVLVDQPACPACPAWALEAPGWLVERPYAMEDVWFLYGLDIHGVAVVLDAAPSDDRRAYVERNGFRYVPVHTGMAVDEIHALCTGAPPPPPVPPPVVAVHGGTRPRYGWKWTGVGKPLEPDPDEQAVIAWLRTERATYPDLTVHALCARMDKHPEFPKRDAKRWHPTAVQRIMEYNGIPVRPNYYAK